MNRPTLLLGAGALGGVLLAVAGLAGGARHPRVPAGAVAVVNGVPISRQSYQAALAAVAEDRRDGRVDPELARHVLDRLVDEELLVQRGVALGLPRLDARVRADLVSAVVAQLDDEATLAPAPDDAALRAFYASDPEFWRTPERVQVTAAWFGGDDGARRAQAARARLDQGGAWDQARAAADRPAVPVPTDAVGPAGLVTALGPTAARTALALAPGVVSAPVITSGGAWLVRLEARWPGQLPRYEDVADLVAREWRRRDGDRRLRAFLERERRRARVELAP